jgi:hypothetical protein
MKQYNENIGIDAIAEIEKILRGEISINLENTDLIEEIDERLNLLL